MDDGTVWASQTRAAHLHLDWNGEGLPHDEGTARQNGGIVRQISSPANALPANAKSVSLFGSLAEFVSKRAVEKAASWKSPKGRTFPLRLRILQQRQDFHFSHRPDDGCTFQFPLGTKNS